MGTYNDFSIDLAVPAAQVAALAAAMRKHTSDWWGSKPDTDDEVVAWALYSAEGGDDFVPEFSRAADDGALLLQCGGYGKLGVDSDEVEAIYAAHGATGIISGTLEDTPYMVAFKDGKVRSYSGEVFYPIYDPMAPILRCLRLLGAEQLLEVRQEADTLRSQVTGLDTEQWVVATGIAGEEPESLVGPFPSTAAADAWKAANSSYMADMAASALDNWVGNPGQEPGAVEHRSWYVNAPQDVEHKAAAQAAEMEEQV